MYLLKFAYILSPRLRRCTIRPNSLSTCINRTMAVNASASDESRPEATNPGVNGLSPKNVVDERKWDAMLQILGSLIAFKNRADALGWRDAFENMPVYLERVGLGESINQLSIIHVAGTKGKGSTCAMVESILRSCGYRTGLFTSPHLVDVRERIRLEGRLVSRPMFHRLFWECHTSLSEKADEEIGVPGYFRFMTLLGLRTFVDYGVDVAILEVGIGGRLDATNVIPPPVVAGITSLGFDHMDMLGDTLELIAREKAGILKAGSPGFTLPQPECAMQALQEVAAQVGTSLTLPRPFDEYVQQDGSLCHVALGGEHQRLNAALAVQLAATWEQDYCRRHSSTSERTTAAAARVASIAAGVLPAEYVTGLAGVQWPGRSQILQDPISLESTSAAALPATSASTPSADATYATTALAAPLPHQGPSLTYFLDGAHTPESMATCAAWFSSELRSNGGRGAGPAKAAPGPTQPGPLRVLLFNCMKERDPTTLLPVLSSSLAEQGAAPHIAIFVAPLSIYGVLHTSATLEQKQQDLIDRASAQDTTWQAELASVWADASRAQAPSGDDAGASDVASGCSSGAGGVVEGLSWLEAGPAVASSNGPPIWSSHGPGCAVAVAASLPAALQWCREASRAQQHEGRGVSVLVTGSLYLVGDMLRQLDHAPN